MNPFSIYTKQLASTMSPSLGVQTSTQATKLPQKKETPVVKPLVTNAPAATTYMNPNPIKPAVSQPQPQSTAKSNYVSSLASSGYAPSTNTNIGMQTQASAPAPVATPKKNDGLSAYRDYLAQYASSLKPSDELNAARQKLGEVQQKIDERSTKARRDYEATLDQAGGTVGGAQQSAAQLSRRDAQELADLGLVESGAARGLAALTGESEANSTYLKNLLELSKPMQMGDSYIDPTTGETIYSKDKEAFNLSEGQKRYEYDATTGQYKEVASVGKTYAPGTSSGYSGSGVGVNNGGTLSALAQAVQNGTITIDKIPSADRAKVAAELATSGVQSSRQQTLSSNLTAVDDLINNPNVSKISGFIEGKLGLGNLKPDAQLALNQYDQIKGILSLENREKLKGSGAISDFEFKVLSEAATALGRNLSDADFKAQLQKVRDVFAGKYAQTNAGATNGAPNVPVQTPQYMQLPNGTVLTLQADGTYQ